MAEQVLNQFRSDKSLREDGYGFEHGVPHVYGAYPYG